MKLIVKLNSEIIFEGTLDPSKEYMVGRSRQCEIILTHTEISRRHLRLKYAYGHWECELLSQYGNLYTSGHPVARLSLADGSTFKVAVFDFYYQETEKSLTAETCVGDKTEVLAGSHATDHTTKLGKGGETTGSWGAKTNVSDVKMKYVLLKVDRQGEAFEELQLGVGLIEAGRDEDCQIMLHDVKASRRHFSLVKSGPSYVITDIESKFGLLVNGEKIISKTLKSGDKIQVGDEIFCYQEIHPHFESLPAETMVNVPALRQLDKHESENVNVVAHHAASSDKKNIRPTLMAFAAAMIVLLVIKLVFYNGDPIKSGNVDALKTNDPLGKFSPDQRKFLDDTYNLSLNLYTSGQYDLAAIEVAKILKMAPNFKDAKNIEALSQQAIEIKKQHDEADRVKHDQEALQQKVEALLVDCEVLYNAQKWSQISECVGRITEVDPENARAKFLSDDASSRMENMETRRQALVENKQKKALAIKLLEHARDLFNNKRYPAAVSDLSSVAKMDFADDSGLKLKAMEALKVARSKMRQDSQVMVQKGKTAFENKEYKNSLKFLSSALELDGTNNEAKDLQIKAAAELRIDMKNIYSESVIEENLGNIESAKKKWRTILDQNVKSDSYYEKAHIKLGKYEK